MSTSYQPPQSRSPLFLAVGFAALAACAPDSPTGPNVPASSTARATFSRTTVTKPAAGPWARIVEGEAGPGAMYALYIPRNWNGDAIYYVHGARPIDEPVDLADDQFTDLRDLLGAQGFAGAYSSWSENGLAVKDGAIRVHQLRGILTAELSAPPSRSFLVSRSLGGAPALELLETYPDQYDGALLTCGMVGGVVLEGTYTANVRVLFDAFYPGALPGGVASAPLNPPLTLQQVAAVVKPNPTPLFVIASLAQTPLPYVPVGSPLTQTSSAFQTLLGSLYGALSLQSLYGANAIDLAHGHNFFDNSTTTYTLGVNPLLPATELQPMVDFANATVARYTAEPSARNYWERYYTPTGDLRVPVITLHNTWDPGIPAFHETALYEKVLAAGATGNLLQRLYPAYGHCQFPTALQAQNFFDLVAWVTTGVKPAR